MHRAIGALALASLAVGTASAQTVDHTFDIGGLEADSGFADAFPSLTHDFGVAGTIIGVTFDITFTSNDPSYQSEATIAIDTNDDLSLDADIFAADYGAPDAPGTFSFSDTFAAASVSSDGLVFLTVWELFNDGVAPDAVYASGSFVTVTYEIIPTPGVGVLLAAAGLLAARRRRA